LIDDEDTQILCKDFLNDLPKNQITVGKFKMWIEDQLLPTITNTTKQKVSDICVRNWLNKLGYCREKVKKGIYHDGHERPDVVEYRKHFLTKMQTYLPHFSTFGGDLNEETMTETRPSNNIDHFVFVVHDKSIFYANDGNKTIWIKKGSTVLRKKGQGSDLICACHGSMIDPDDPANRVREIIHPGKNHDGYWTNEKLNQQVKKAITIFEKLHPGSIAVFAFDNSQNHNAYAKDALLVSSLNLSWRKEHTIVKRGLFR
jgi:hypothetical protein